MCNRAEGTRGIVDSVEKTLAAEPTVWSSLAAEAHTLTDRRAFDAGGNLTFEQGDLSNSVRNKLIYLDPVAREELSAENKGLPAVLEAYTRASMAYIDAQVALLDAGISPLALDATQRNRALDIEEVAVKGMGRLVRSLPPGQLSTVLATTNEQIRDTGRRFAYSQFGGISLVEGNSAMWNLGNVQRRSYT